MRFEHWNKLQNTFSFPKNFIADFICAVGKCGLNRVVKSRSWKVLCYKVGNEIGRGYA